MHVLFLFLAFVSSPSDCEASSRSPSLRQSASSAPYYSPSGAPAADSPITERTAELSSNDNGFLRPDKRDVGTIVYSSTPTPSSRPSMFASSPRTDSFKLYFTLYLSPASSKMDVATTNFFENSTLEFMTENVPTFPGVAVDVNSIVVIGQLLVKQEESNMDNDQVPVLQIDVFVSGSIAMDFHITNLTRIAVQNSISLTLFSRGPSLQSHLHAASVFFESIDQITTSYQNDNGLVVAVSTEANAIGISKPAVLATAGTLTLFLIMILGGFMSFRRYRKRGLRKKKISSTHAPDPTDSIDENCRERPPVQHIASDDLASVTSSVSGISEIFCGALRCSKGEVVSGTRVIKERYPIQERRTNGSKQQYSTQENRSDQASNVSVLSDLFFDNWSVFSAILHVETTPGDTAANGPTASDNDDDLVGTFVVKSLGQDNELSRCNLSGKVTEIQQASEASAWAGFN